MNDISEDNSLNGPVIDLRLGLFLRPGCWLSFDWIFIFNDPENLKSFHREFDILCRPPELLFPPNPFPLPQFAVG